MSDNDSQDEPGIDKLSKGFAENFSLGVEATSEVSEKSTLKVKATSVVDSSEAHTRTERSLSIELVYVKVEDNGVYVAIKDAVLHWLQGSLVGVLPVDKYEEICKQNPPMTFHTLAKPSGNEVDVILRDILKRKKDREAKRVLMLKALENWAKWEAYFAEIRLDFSQPGNITTKMPRIEIMISEYFQFLRDITDDTSLDVKLSLDEKQLIQSVKPVDRWLVFKCMVKRVNDNIKAILVDSDQDKDIVDSLVALLENYMRY